MSASSNFFDKSSHPNKDFNLLYRTRNSDVIFRARQEALLQREKLLNPRKFRAGAFTGTSLRTEKSINDELSRLELRLNSISQNKSTHSREGSDYYKLHLYDSILRKRSDLNQHQFLYGGRSSTGSSGQDEGLLVGLITTLAIFGGLVILLTNSFFSIDIPAKMDEKLKQLIKRKTSDKARDNMEATEEDLRKNIVLIKR